MGKNNKKTKYYYTSKIFIVKANKSKEGCSIGSLWKWQMGGRLTGHSLSLVDIP